MHLNTGEQGSEEDRAWLISVVPNDRPADNGHKLNYNKIYLNLRNKKKKRFTVKFIKHCYRFWKYQYPWRYSEPE